MVHTMAQQPGHEGTLLLVGLLHVFDAPMGEGDDHVGFQRLGLGQVAGYLHRVFHVHHEGLGHGNAVGAIGEVEQTDAYAVVFDDEGILLVAFGGILISAEVMHLQRVHHVDGTPQTPLTRVHAVVVGGEQHIKAGVDAGQQIFVGGAELGISPVGRAAQRHLEVGDGQVGLAHLVFHPGEHIVVIIGAVGHAGGLDLTVVLHQVAGEEQGHLMCHSIGAQTVAVASLSIVLGIALATDGHEQRQEQQWFEFLVLFHE